MNWSDLAIVGGRVGAAVSKSKSCQVLINDRSF